jgi:UDP-N-acetylglucosamine 1-carboxyvinyltransferase
VGATENIMLFAVTCKGTTRIINAAKEPEISDLQDYLNAIGYRVKGAGSPVIEIEGKSELPATYVRHRPIPDRIAAATWLCAGAMTGGTVELRSARPDHMKAALDALKESGSMIHVQGDRITLIGPPRPKAIPRLKTSPFPGFPTDAQPLFFALASVSKGRTFIEETMFENRFSFGPDLARMGAGVFIRGKFAAIDGTSELKGQSVVAKDLRGGAALVLAGLAAEGQTIIDQAGYIDRGYEHIEKTLALLGASIWRT